jgi:hypothetical protein
LISDYFLHVSIYNFWSSEVKDSMEPLEQRKHMIIYSFLGSMYYVYKSMEIDDKIQYEILELF